MALAVKNATETPTRPALHRLAVGSLLGALYVLVSLAIVFYGIPSVWSATVSHALANLPAIDAALMILVMLGAGAGLSYLGARLLGPHPPHGLKAGTFTGLMLVLLVALVTEWVGSIVERIVYTSRMFGESGPAVGLAITVVVGVCLLIVGIRFFFRPAFERHMTALENQGWFSLDSYKRSQGQRVRRATIVSVLILAGCGIFTLLSHRTLDSGPADWGIAIPFTSSVTVTDPGDTRVLKNSVLDKNDKVRIIDPGKQGEKQWRRGDIVSRQDYDAEVARRAKAGQSSKPVAGPMVNRYELRDLNDAFARTHVRITDPGKSSKFKKNDVVSREQFQEEKERLEKDNLPAPTAEAPRLASGVTEYKRISLLPHVRFTLPILLAAFSLWLAYRLVNFPPFADFLIATEAELNKVSWVTRKRLVQDTVVVLVTMLLLTVFLFVVDLIWFKTLSWRYIGVIHIPESGVSTAEVDSRIEQLESELGSEQDPKKQNDIRAQITQAKKERERMRREKPEDRLDW
jgi:preprotein translocase SecE subunit